MSCTRMQIKNCKDQGGQPTWNVSKKLCICATIKTDDKGKKIPLKGKDGKILKDKSGDTVYDYNENVPKKITR